MNRAMIARAALMVSIAVAIGIIGGTWETAAIRKYERIEGKSLGLFQTPNGDHYRRWGNEVPLIATLVTLAIYVALATPHAWRWGLAPLVSLWIAAVMVGVAIAWYSAFLGMNADGHVL